MLTFALVIFLSFTAVATATSYILVHYAQQSKQSLTDELSFMIFDDIKNGLDTFDGSFTAAVASFNSYYSYSDRFAEMNDSLIFITDTSGVVLYTSGAFHNIHKPRQISKTIIKEYQNNSGKLTYGTLGGILPNKYFNSAYPIYAPNSTDTDTPLGILFISASSNGMNDTINHMISIILLVLFWVFVAAFTALYFIGERLNKPTLLLQEKLRHFAHGDFSIRMPHTNVEEIDRIGISFNDMAASLEKTEASRRTFISNISHDLRTPMTGIQGFVEAMLDGTIKPENRDHYLSIISKETKRLSRLVNELLDISRIESKTLCLNKTVFDFCEMARLIIISLEERMNKKNIEFHMQTEPYRANVFADKDSIYQVMYNIMDNAIKFCDDGGKITIHITKCSYSEPSICDKYIISIFNTGIGLDEEEATKVFDRFYKSDSSRGKDPHGSGLGLFIVKTILDLHEETISVSGKKGSYCQFDFSLTSADSSRNAN